MLGLENDDYEYESCIKNRRKWLGVISNFLEENKGAKNGKKSLRDSFVRLRYGIEALMQMRMYVYRTADNEHCFCTDET